MNEEKTRKPKGVFNSLGAFAAMQTWHKTTMMRGENMPSMKLKVFCMAKNQVPSKMPKNERNRNQRRNCPPDNSFFENFPSNNEVQRWYELSIHKQIYDLQSFSFPMI